MKTLRASASRITSEVVVGKNQYGGDVTVTVTLDRKDDEVVAVLSQLDALLRRRAFSHLNEAIEEATVQRRVSEKLVEARASITRTAKANAEATMNGKIRELERELETARRLARTTQDANTRLQQQLQATTEKEG